MDNMNDSGECISEPDKAFAKEFENFVNGRMVSADTTGRELTKAHRYLQQQMFKVFMGFVRQLALNYKEGRYDDRNERASYLAYAIYNHLLDDRLLHDPDFINSKPYFDMFYEKDFPEYGKQCELLTPCRGYNRGTIVAKTVKGFIVQLTSGAEIEVYDDEIEFD